MPTEWPKVVRVRREGEERFVIGFPPKHDPSVSWRGYEASVPMSEPLSEDDLRSKLMGIGLDEEEIQAKIEGARKAG